jgi:hypothetical protein
VHLKDRFADWLWRHRSSKGKIVVALVSLVAILTIIFNGEGKKGWELVAVSEERATFKRRLS